MRKLPGKRAHALEVCAWYVQALRRKVEFVFRHGFGSFDHFFFDEGDLAVNGGSDGWRGTLDSLSPGACAREQQQHDSEVFHSQVSRKAKIGSTFVARLAGR